VTLFFLLCASLIERRASGIFYAIHFSEFSQSRRALRCSPRCMRSSFQPYLNTSHSRQTDPQKRVPEEVHEPGALYAECAVAPIRMPTTVAPSAEEKTDGGGGDGKLPSGGATVRDDGVRWHRTRYGGVG
jgi:hypothetical protein